MKLFIRGKPVAPISEQQILDLRFFKTISVIVVDSNGRLVDMALLQVIGPGFGVLSVHNGSDQVWQLKEIIHE